QSRNPPRRKRHRYFRSPMGAAALKAGHLGWIKVTKFSDREYTLVRVTLIPASTADLVLLALQPDGDCGERENVLTDCIYMRLLRVRDLGGSASTSPYQQR